MPSEWEEPLERADVMVPLVAPLQGSKVAAARQLGTGLHGAWCLKDVRGIKSSTVGVRGQTRPGYAEPGGTMAAAGVLLVPVVSMIA